MFITFEGPEGGGKTSHVSRWPSFCENRATRLSPHASRAAQKLAIRCGRFSPVENTSMKPRTETLLFLAARAQLVEQCIRPELSQNHIVLSDRYADSTLAYQGYGHGNDWNSSAPARFCHRQLWPDLTLLLDIDPELGCSASAAAVSGTAWTPIRWHFTSASGMGIENWQQDPQRWVMIDANQPFDDSTKSYSSGSRKTFIQPGNFPHRLKNRCVFFFVAIGADAANDYEVKYIIQIRQDITMRKLLLFLIIRYCNAFFRLQPGESCHSIRYLCNPPKHPHAHPRPKRSGDGMRNCRRSPHPRPTEISMFPPQAKMIGQWAVIDAVLTITEYSDFQCPYCAMLAADLKQLVEKHPEDIRVVFRHFPLPSHPLALDACLCL
jgi:dTMP kinase